MAKGDKPKVNPKLQRLKRMPVDELDRVCKQTAIKAACRGAKAVKMSLVLKCTKKIATQKQSEADSEKPSEALQAEIDRLKVIKAVDHTAVGNYLAFDRFPTVFSREEIKNRAQLDIPADILSQFVASKKLDEEVHQVQGDILMLQTQKDEKLRKQQNVINAQAVTKRPASIGKSAAHKAIFVESLQDDPEEEGDDGSQGSHEGADSDDDEAAAIAKRKEQWRMDKAARNRENRASNKRKRDDDQQSTEPYHKGRPEKKKGHPNDTPKTDLSMYMPVDQRRKFLQRQQGGNRDKPKDKQPNRAERRQQMREQPASTDKKPMETSEDKPSTRKRTEIAPEIKVPSKSHHDLSQFATVGKEWKETGVHPSWAAKQISKPQIVQNQGKKITFD